MTVTVTGGINCLPGAGTPVQGGGPVQQVALGGPVQQGSGGGPDISTCFIGGGEAMSGLPVTGGGALGGASVTPSNQGPAPAATDHAVHHGMHHGGNAMMPTGFDVSPATANPSSGLTIGGGASGNPSIGGEIAAAVAGGGAAAPVGGGLMIGGAQAGGGLIIGGWVPIMGTGFAAEAAARSGAPLVSGIPGTGGTLPTPPASAAAGGGPLSGDQQLVASALLALQQSGHGARLVDQLISQHANVLVLSDEEFAAAGEQAAHAFYNPANDAIYLRRSDLQKDVRLAAVEFAHEGVHLLDDKGRVADAFIKSESARIAAITDPAAREAAVQQTQFELTMIKEARAFTFTGRIAYEIGLQLAQGDPTGVAAQGGNDQSTYSAVWQALLGSNYNPQRRTAAIRDFPAG